MQLFLSTTFHGNESTDLADVLRLIEGLDLDGVELGSTHRYRPDLEVIVREGFERRLVTHNFFPPAEQPDFVINLAAEDTAARESSLAHARQCIEVAARLGAEVYTVHPGFLAKPASSSPQPGRYDFEFGEERTAHETAFTLMLDALGELGELAAGEGVTLAVETEGSLTNQGVLLMETFEEYDRLFAAIPRNISLNFNLAHTRFAAKAHGYTVDGFLDRYRDRIAVVEVSHNDGYADQHLPLIEGSYVFEHLDQLPDVPLILEFRNASAQQLQISIALMRTHSPRRIS